MLLILCLWYIKIERGNVTWTIQVESNFFVFRKGHKLFNLKFVSSAFAFVCFEISTHYFLKFQPYNGLKFQTYNGLKFQEIIRWNFKTNKRKSRRNKLKSPKFWNPRWPIFLAAILQPVSKAVFNDLPLIKDAMTQAIKVFPAPQLSRILGTCSAWTKSTCPSWSIAPAPKGYGNTGCGVFKRGVRN